MGVFLINFATSIFISGVVPCSGAYVLPIQFQLQFFQGSNSRYSAAFHGLEHVCSPSVEESKIAEDYMMRVTACILGLPLSLHLLLFYSVVTLAHQWSKSTSKSKSKQRVFSLSTSCTVSFLLFLLLTTDHRHMADVGF